MRRLLTLAVFIMFGVGACNYPAQSQTLLMPDLSAAGYVEVGSIDSSCSMGEVVITRHEWQLAENKDSNILDAVSFSVEGNEYLVLIFWYTDREADPVRVTFYSIQNGAVSIQWLTYEQLLNLGKGACDFLPQ